MSKKQRRFSFLPSIDIRKGNVQKGMGKKTDSPITTAHIAKGECTS